MSDRPRLLFVVTADWYFCSHRLALAVAAREAGYDVAVATLVDAHAEVIRDAGLTLFPVPFCRSWRRPWRDIASAWRLFGLVRTWRPDVVHFVALKPILLGLAARLSHRACLSVHAITGLGFIFASQRRRARALRPLLLALLRLQLRSKYARVIVQNPDDAAMLTEHGLADLNNMRLIRGAGVDLELFHPASEAPSSRIVLLPARMLVEKGVREFASAARELRREFPDVRFVLAGALDPDNPGALPRAELAAWQAEDIVEWWQRRDDMAEVYRMAELVCLPSYREGLPKSLIEAVASGLPVVTTDVPGCREVVRQGENGFLVPARQVPALIDALRRLLADVELRQRMGADARERAGDFSQATVSAQTLAVYGEGDAASRHAIGPGERR